MTSSATEMEPVLVNGRWPLMLPPHRAARPEWPWYEAARFAAMRHALRTGDTVYDIGSEEGDHAAVFASWGCDVVLLEPNPKAWPCARAIFQANNLSHAVVGWWWGYVADADDDVNRPGRYGTAFDWPGTGGWPAAADGPIDPGHGMAHLCGRADPLPVPPQPTVRLDTLTASPSRPAPPTALTVDVEGAELAVLLGATETLARWRPIVWVSIHPALMPDYGATPDMVFDLMESLGYDRTHLATDHEEHWQFTPRAGP